MMSNTVASLPAKSAALTGLCRQSCCCCVQDANYDIPSHGMTCHDSSCLFVIWVWCEWCKTFFQWWPGTGASFASDFEKGNNFLFRGPTGKIQLSKDFLLRGFPGLSGRWDQSCKGSWKRHRPEILKNLVLACLAWLGTRWVCRMPWHLRVPSWFGDIHMNLHRAGGQHFSTSPLGQA